MDYRLSSLASRILFCFVLLCCIFALAGSRVMGYKHVQVFLSLVFNTYSVLFVKNFTLIKYVQLLLALILLVTRRQILEHAVKSISHCYSFQQLRKIDLVLWYCICLLCCIFPFYFKSDQRNNFSMSFIFLNLFKNK